TAPAIRPRPVAISMDLTQRTPDARGPSGRRSMEPSPTALKGRLPLHHALGGNHCNYGRMATMSRPQAGALRRRQELPLPRDWLPRPEPRERVPNHCAHVGNAGFAEFAFQRLADRLGQPGAAADIEPVGVGMALEGRAAELIGELHVIGGRDLLE